MIEKTSKSPAFQFYVQDFLSGVKFFTAEETGAYVLLLCEQWDSGFIENNEKILKKITGISPKKLQKVLEKFEIFENKLVNKRMAEEKAKRDEFIDRARKAGEESAKKRAEEKARLVEIELQLKSKSSLSSSSSTSKEKEVLSNYAEIKISADSESVNDNSFEKEKTAFTDSVDDKPKKENKLSREEKPKSVYILCMDVYNDFILQKTTLPAKVDGAEGNALKSIIKYLNQVSADKTDQGVANSFRHILSLSQRWDPFHQNQIKLIQINSNLINIINTIKNGNKKSTTNAYDQSKYR